MNGKIFLLRDTFLPYQFFPIEIEKFYFQIIYQIEARSKLNYQFFFSKEKVKKFHI
jgi:hypothetical protein